MSGRLRRSRGEGKERLILLRGVPQRERDVRRGDVAQGWRSDQWGVRAGEMSSVSDQTRWYSVRNDRPSNAGRSHSPAGRQTRREHEIAGSHVMAMDYRLPTSVVPIRYDLRLEPDLVAASFTGEESITVTVSEPVTDVVLNA